MSGTPTFQITNAGLQAASIASPTGPWISITGFQIGSGYGYTPLPTDPGLSGSLLFSGTPTSYQNIGSGTLDILCEIPPNAGPFQFGEIALMLPGNVMFAKAVFPVAQTKFSALGSNVVSSYELHCLLTLAQGTAIFQITTAVPTTLLQVFSWSDIYPPRLSADPTVPLVQVMELSEYGDATLLSNASNSKWSIEGSTYQRYDNQGGGPSFSVANASSTWIEILAASLNPLDLTNINSNRFVIETPDNYFRSVSTVVPSGSSYRFTLNGTPLQTVPAVGSSVVIYRDDQAQGVSYYSQILDPLYYDKAQLALNTGTVNAYAATYKQKNPIPYEGMIRSLDVGNITNTGASTFACDGGAPYPIIGQASLPLQGGEISGAVTLRFSTASNNWIIQSSASGALQIPNALHSQHALSLGQAQADFAALNGNASLPFYASLLESEVFQAPAGVPALLESDVYTASVNRAGNNYVQHYAAPATTGQAAVILSQFPSSLDINGYKKYPDPSSPTGYFIEQWGTGTYPTQLTTTSNFPIAFPVAVLNFTVSLGSGINLTTFNDCGGEPISLSQFQISVGSTSIGSDAVWWTAKGY